MRAGGRSRSLGRLVVQSSAVASLLLDTYPGAAAAYSVARKLRTAYAGPAIRVRRSIDNAEQNVGFTSGVLDTASLLAFVGANDGFVTTLYDQSGATAALTQTTAASQPQIVAAGAVLTNSGKPAILYSGNKFLVANLSVSGSAVWTYSTFNRQNTANTNVRIVQFSSIGGLGSGVGTNDFIAQYTQGTNGVVSMYKLSAFGHPQSANPAILQSCLSRINADSTKIVLNSVSATGTLTSANTISTKLYAGGHGGAAEAFQGSLCELIIYLTNQSAVEDATLVSIRNFYGTP